MKDKLSDTIRIGKVASIDEQKATARVTFEDRQDIVSNDLPLVVPFTLKDKAYYMPSIGERVICVFNPDAPSRGFIIGSFYADTRLPPIKDENKTYLNYEDNTLIEYDKKEHKLTIKVLEDSQISVDIYTKSNIIVNCDKNATINVKGNTSIDTKGNTSIKTGGSMDITSGGSMTIKGAMVKIN